MLSDEIKSTVFFKVTVNSMCAEGGMWITHCDQTGVVGFGHSQEESEKECAEMHEALVRQLKRNGALALISFMNKRGIPFRCGEIHDAETHAKSVAGSDPKELAVAA